MKGRAVVLRGDARQLPLPGGSVDLIVTSPPYWALRDYQDGDQSLGGQIGNEPSPQEYLQTLLECTVEWARVLKPTGSMFVNLGDKYAQDSERSRNGQGARKTTARGGLTGTDGYLSTETVQLGRRRNGVPRKSLIGLPWRYAIGCIEELGLILRAEIIWSKTNGLPESVADRVRRSHEHWFHLVKQPRYYSAVDEIREPIAPESWTKKPGAKYFKARSEQHQAVNGGGASGAYAGPNPLGKLPSSVWEVATQPLNVPEHLGADHYAAFPVEFPRRIILGWSPPCICAECGEGRRPTTTKASTGLRNEQGTWNGGSLGLKGRNDAPRTRAIGISTTVTGYDCACTAPDAPSRPAVVLDPFGGTGTTALVASVLGRIGISVDRSLDYCRIAQWRTTDQGERARALGAPKPPPVADGQERLFEEID